MYAPHSVTLFNGDHVTYLDGVLCDEGKAANVQLTGLDGADAVRLFIPLDVVATNADTGASENYVPPKAFTGDNGWTLRVSSQNGANDCFFVKGKVSSRGKFQEINALHGAYRVHSVDIRDFGTADMRHWEVGGR